MSHENNAEIKRDLFENIGEWASPELKARLHEHNARRKILTPGEMSDLIEEEFLRRGL